jgi:hypothetical protein
MIEALLPTLAAALLSMWGLSCTDPQVIISHGLERPGFYVRTLDGANEIRIRGGMSEDMTRRVLVHELAHCGMYEDRQARGIPHPPSMDMREERQAQIIERSIAGDRS